MQSNHVATAFGVARFREPRRNDSSVGGGVYNLGTFLVDAATVIAHNRASDGSDNYFGG